MVYAGMGLCLCKRSMRTPQLLANAGRREAVGEPYAGNPHVRFDEGEQSDGAFRPRRAAPYSTGEIRNGNGRTTTTDGRFSRKAGRQESRKRTNV